jgi:hypothetical protein
VKPPTPVTVTTWHQELSYPWATSVRLDRRGDLHILQGWRQRAFHPAGEWTKYTVAAPEQAAVPGTIQRIEGQSMG